MYSAEEVISNRNNIPSDGKCFKTDRPKFTERVWKPSYEKRPRLAPGIVHKTYQKSFLKTLSNPEREATRLLSITCVLVWCVSDFFFNNNTKAQ